MPEGVIAILTEEGFEDLELYAPKFAFEQFGFRTEILTPDGKKREGKHGYTIDAKGAIKEKDARRYAGVHIPGGVENGDKIRSSKDAVAFVRDAFDETIPIFSICHGPWLLVEADVVDGLAVTSWPSLKTDLKNAGATWKDQAVVTDENLVTSRMPEDLPQYARAALDLLGVETRAGGRATGARKEAVAARRGASSRKRAR